MNHLKYACAILLCGTVAFASRDSSPPASAVAPSSHAPQASAGDCPCGPGCRCGAALQAEIDSLRAQLAVQIGDLDPGESVEVPIALPDSVLDAFNSVPEPIESTYEPTPADPETFGRVYIEPPADAGPPSNDQNGYLTRAAITDWLATHSGGSGYRTPSGEDPWEHLQTDHGWLDWQVESLSYADAEKLHNASHNGLISSRSQLSAPDYQIPSTSTAGVPIYWRNDQWEWRHNGKWFGNPNLYEGWYSADGQFRYADGRMLVYQLVTPAQTAPATSTTAAPTPQRPASQSYSNCPNGQCGRPRGFFGRRGR